MLIRRRDGRPLPFVETLERFIELDGRSSRGEYWSFWLINSLVWEILNAVSGGFHLGGPGRFHPGLASLYALLVAVPSFSVGVRRMHDTGRSGIWSIVPLFGTIFALGKGVEGENKYGLNPLDEV